MKAYAYRNFVRTLSERVAQSLSTIETEHNFEYGVEFEIALCDALRSALPDRYGINRGYVVAEDGRAAGDDIVISARERFPTLALRGRDDFARKEFVPVEAAYCYIEAKHTLELVGSGAQSLTRACEQVSHVKELCRSRPDVTADQLAPYLRVTGPNKGETPPDFPVVLNPMFGVVFARYVREKSGGPPITDPEQLQKLLHGCQFTSGVAPDLIVLGEHIVIVPAISMRYRSPFYIEGKSVLHARAVDGIAFGLALTSIMAALDWIQLGVMPWHRIAVDALDIPFD